MVIRDQNSDTETHCAKRRRGKRWFLELVVFAVLMVAIYSYQTRNLIPSGGEPAPALAGPLLSGQKFSMSDLDSDHTLVYFFAPWCAYCSASMDNINRLRRWDDEESLAIVLVALDWQSADEIAAYAERHELSVPILLGDVDDAEQWHVYAFPTYYVLDGEGRIVSSDMGYSTMAGLYSRTR